MKKNILYGGGDSTLLIVMVIGIVIILVGVYYFIYMQPTPPSSTPAPTTTTSSTIAPTTTTSSTIAPTTTTSSIYAPITIKDESLDAVKSLPVPRIDPIEHAIFPPGEGGGNPQAFLPPAFMFPPGEGGGNPRPIFQPGEDACEFITNDNDLLGPNNIMSNLTWKGACCVDGSCDCKGRTVTKCGKGNDGKYYKTRQYYYYKSNLHKLDSPDGNVRLSFTKGYPSDNPLILINGDTAVLPKPHVPVNFPGLGKFPGYGGGGIRPIGITLPGQGPVALPGPVKPFSF